MAETDPMPIGVTAVMLPELDFDEQASLAAELGLAHYVYRPRVIGEKQRDKPYSNWGNHRFDLTPQRLVKQGAALTRRLRDAGIEPFGTVPHATLDDDEDTLRLHFEGAAAAEATAVRINPHLYPGGLFDYGAYVQRVVDGYHRAAELAAEYGVRMTIETHARSGSSSPALARAILERVDHERVRAIVDLPNFAREGFVQPNLAVSVLSPWIDHVHLGGSKVVAGGYDAHGFRQRGELFTSLAESELHIPTWLRWIKAAAGPVPLILEDYTPNMPGAARLRRAVAETRAALAAAEQLAEGADA